MPDSGRNRYARGFTWSDDERAIIAAHEDLSLGELAVLLPGRSRSAISNVRFRQAGRKKPLVRPAVKVPGEYIETLSAYLVDEFDCVEIWMKWHGYSAWRELSRDCIGWVTMLCTAK